MAVYTEDEAVQYDQILRQPIYKYYVNKKISSIEKWLDNNSVLLDVGCGTGVYTDSLAKKCRTIVGMDISPRMVVKGLAKAKELGVNNVHFIVADAAHFPFRDQTFDLVFSVNLFHHVVEKGIVAKSFLEQKRCSRTEGHILVFELNPNSLGWSKDAVPKIIRGFVHLVLYPVEQHVTDNVEENTRMVNISELYENMKEANVVSKTIGGFIPTYCPLFLFRVFVLLEKALETMPILKRYGAHVLIVGEIR
jgi:ubiquinone/menaquinone biosynthesis C-methylase UbiE